MWHIRSDAVDRLLAEQPARHVEVVDRHVAEHAPRHLEVGERRRRRIAARDHHLLDCADLALVEARLQRAEARIEAAVEADEHRHAGLFDLLDAGIHFGKREIDRLFAEDRLAGARRGDGEPRVRIGGGGDEHGAGLAVGERFALARHLGTVPRGELLRRLGIDVDDVAQPHVLHGGDVRGVDLADASGAELGDFQHSCLCMINR
jgi:hypothetical protein